MKKLFLLLPAIIVLFLIGGCVKDIDNGNNVESSMNSSGPIDKTSIKNVFIKGDNLSGFNISGYYNDILISGEKLIYSGIFTINIPEEIIKREYSKRYYEDSDTYTDRLILNDKNIENNLSIESYKTTSSISEICDYNSEYGGKLSSRKIMNVGGIKVYFLNSSFFISSPDTKPSTSYESSICFISNNTLYKILISSNVKYNQDIINSFKFIN